MSRMTYVMSPSQRVLDSIPSRGPICDASKTTTGSSLLDVQWRTFQPVGPLLQQSVRLDIRTLRSTCRDTKVRAHPELRPMVYNQASAPKSFHALPKTKQIASRVKQDSSAKQHFEHLSFIDLRRGVLRFAQKPTHCLQRITQPT